MVLEKFNRVGDWEKANRFRSKTEATEQYHGISLMLIVEPKKLCEECKGFSSIDFKYTRRS